MANRSGPRFFEALLRCPNGCWTTTARFKRPSADTGAGGGHEAPSAHRRPGDSLAGCSSAEPASASPGFAILPNRTEPSDIAVIPQKNFPEYSRAPTKIHEEPPLGETAFAQQANAREGRRLAKVLTTSATINSATSTIDVPSRRRIAQPRLSLDTSCDGLRNHSNGERPRMAERTHGSLAAVHPWVRSAIRGFIQIGH
ncbi:hypothetical protein Enr13x_28340 [Stieleria neptunia]|uniref:Uncharacterized protein n=1 Tax=Stieleria neptunia TaxID=2527979 RepID=A0A518HQ60_9BACT|nr:hypothetical protein Enr13x_28340 [Stieleria neptunia]